MNFVFTEPNQKFELQDVFLKLTLELCDSSFDDSESGCISLESESVIETRPDETFHTKQ